jgi:hypothetical protein
VLIVSELARIGRDTVRTPYAVQQVEEAGVEIHGYFSSQRISVVDEMGEMQTMLRSLGARYERRMCEPAQLRRQPASIRGGRGCRRPRVRLLQPTRRCRVCARGST